MRRNIKFTIFKFPMEFLIVTYPLPITCFIPSIMPYIIPYIIPLS